MECPQSGTAFRGMKKLSAGKSLKRSSDFCVDQPDIIEQQQSKVKFSPSVQRMPDYIASIMGCEETLSDETPVADTIWGSLKEIVLLW